MGYMSFFRRSRYYRKGIISDILRQIDSEIDHLVLHRRYPYRGWSLLKGSLDRKPEIEALKKELREEANIKDKDILNIQKIPNLKVKYKFPRSTRLKRRKDYTCIGQDLQAYVVEVDPKTIVQLDFIEHNDYMWVRLPQAKKMLRFNDHKKVVEAGDKIYKNK